MEEFYLNRDNLLANGYSWQGYDNNQYNLWGYARKGNLRVELSSNLNVGLVYLDEPYLNMTIHNCTVDMFNSFVNVLPDKTLLLKGNAVDNFEAFKKMMRFDNDDEFYFLQILIRKKDGHTESGINGNNSNRLIKFYCIHSIEELDEKKNEIIALCEAFNARAYIHPSRRNENDIADEVLKLTTNTYLDRTLRHKMKAVYSRACGIKEVDRIWVVDIDTKDIAEVEKYKSIINECSPFGDKIINVLPTKNGYHIISRPFDLNAFKLNGGSNIDVHKNNPTLLYCK